MFKAVKNNKPVAINDSGIFPCLIYDYVEEDSKNVVSDYAQYNGEFFLKSEVPLPTREEQKSKRAMAYATQIDPITMHIQRLRDETPPNDEKIEALTFERQEKVEKIKNEYPYFD